MREIPNNDILLLCIPTSPLSREIHAGYISLGTFN